MKTNLVKLVAIAAVFAAFLNTASASVIYNGPQGTIIQTQPSESGYESYSGAVPSYYTVVLFVSTNKDYYEPSAEWAKASADDWGYVYSAYATTPYASHGESDSASFYSTYSYSGFTLEVFANTAYNQTALAGIEFY